MLALSETTLKGKSECYFECVSGRMSGVTRGRAMEGMALIMSCSETVCGGMVGSVIKADVGESKV